MNSRWPASTTAPKGIASPGIGSDGVATTLTSPSRAATSAGTPRPSKQSERMNMHNHAERSPVSNKESDLDHPQRQTPDRITAGQGGASISGGRGLLGVEGSQGIWSTRSERPSFGVQ
jgi:hypothetical protein